MGSVPTLHLAEPWTEAFQTYHPGLHIAAKTGDTSLSASMAQQVLQNLLASPEKDGDREPPPRGG